MAADDNEDQDFRSRYAAETKGMPANLAAVAARNLAAEDASIGRVNAAARSVTLPGVGTSYSTPSTDATNTDLAAGMDRASLFNNGDYSPEGDSASAPPTGAGGIDISAVNARRNMILNNVDPDAPALYVSDKPGRNGISRKQELQHELGTLTNVVHENALETAAQAHEDLVKQRSIDVANQSTAIFKGLQDIPPDGSPASEAAVQKLIAQNRTAFDVSPAVREEVTRHSKVHDAAATALNTTKTTATDDKEYLDTLHQVNEYARTRGVTPVFDPESGMPSIDLTREYADEHGPMKPGPKANAAYVKQAATVAGLQAAKDAAYNANPKADLTLHDRNIGIEKAKLNAMAEALGVNTASASSLSPQDQAAVTWANANPKDPRAAAIKKLHGL